MGAGDQGGGHQHPRVTPPNLEVGSNGTTMIEPPPIASPVGRRNAAAPAFAAGLLGRAALAQTQTPVWPGRFVRMIVPYPAGRRGRHHRPAARRAALGDLGPAGTDREPRRGRRHNIATEAAARSAPDGYTMLPGGTTSRRPTAISIQNSATIRSPTSFRSPSWSSLRPHGRAELLACAFGQGVHRLRPGEPGKVTLRLSRPRHRARISQANCSSASPASS